MTKASFWDVSFSRLLSAYAITIFAILWIGFAIALIVNPEWLDQLWSWVQGLPLAARIVVWLVLLPITAGLWIWTSSGPDLLRLLGLAGIIGWTLLALSSVFRYWRQDSAG